MCTLIWRRTEWRVGGRLLRFLHLAGGQSMQLPAGEHYVKVILGRLDNIDRTCLAAPFTVRTTRVHENELTAGSEGALFALMTLFDDAPRQFSDMSQLVFQGERDDCLTWRTFEERFSGVTDFFDDKDCYMADGFHLLDEGGRELVYVNPWTCGKGVDLSTHNHGHPPSDLAPAFAEVHWVLAASTDASGMYETPEPGSPTRVRHAMGLGDEHGPFYDRDDQGLPKIRDNGAVQYPWHGWQGGTDDQPGQGYDVVLAFEINPACIEPRL